MKKILLLTVSMMTLFLSSCVVIPKPVYSSDVYYLDYFKLGHDGKILLSESNSYSGEYQSIGSIIVEQISGYEQILVSTSTSNERIGDDIYGEKNVVKKKAKYKLGEFKEANFSSALEEAVAVAEEMGGNAIINLKITTPVDSSVRVTGMVIKRM